MLEDAGAVIVVTRRKSERACCRRDKVRTVDLERSGGDRADARGGKSGEPGGGRKPGLCDLYLRFDRRGLKE